MGSKDIISKSVLSHLTYRTLAENRDLQPNIKEAEQMLISKFNLVASYSWSMRDGIEQGRG